MRIGLRVLDAMLRLARELLSRVTHALRSLADVTADFVNTGHIARRGLRGVAGFLKLAVRGTTNVFRPFLDAFAGLLEYTVRGVTDLLDRILRAGRRSEHSTQSDDRQSKLKRKTQARRTKVPDVTQSFAPATSEMNRTSRPDSITAMIDADPGLRALLGEVTSGFDADAAHDMGHLTRVAQWTMRLAGDGISARLGISAALLHDIVNVPKTHPDRARASERSAAVARELLSRLDFPPAEIALIADAIRDHGFSRGAMPDSALGQALQDADRLEALGVIGTFRCIATGVRFNAAFFHATDPWAADRPLDDARYSVDHYFTKLLTLPATFHTVAGRAEAQRRAGTMRALLESLALELEQPLARVID